ncbi:hypothetical protein NSP_38650 [Nodularia spumigena CCY9414]|nr:hypothetical protein NSP_38650 [Nodularia spumigena CCY9414]
MQHLYIIFHHTDVFLKLYKLWESISSFKSYIFADLWSLITDIT